MANTRAYTAKPARTNVKTAYKVPMLPKAGTVFFTTPK